MKSRSKYDELHDQFYSITTTKKGTRYERLTAFIFKEFDESNCVIHDIKLIGESDVPHQIDVLVESDNKKKNILVECKDFDIGQKNVGISIIRDFYGVVSDVNPDEAFVVSTCGFTTNAKKYAKHHNIKLLVIRKFTDEDWQNRIGSINVNFYIVTAGEPQVDIYVDEKNKDFFNREMNNLGFDARGISEDLPIFVEIDGQKETFFSFLNEIMLKNLPWQPESVSLPVSFSDKKLLINDNEVPIKGLKINFEAIIDSDSMTILANSIATMILSGFEENDLVITDKPFKNFLIDPETGEVSEVEKP